MSLSRRISYAGSKKPATGGAGACAGRPSVCRRSMEIFIPGMSCSGKERIFQCLIGHEGSGGNRQTT